MEHFGSQQLHDGVADALARLKNAAERLDREKMTHLVHLEKKNESIFPGIQETGAISGGTPPGGGRRSA
jgi:ribosomal protein S8